MKTRNIFRLTALFLMISFLTGCMNEDAVFQTLSDAGFSHIQLKGYAWQLCGEDDAYKTKFVAVPPGAKSEKRAEGAVCCGAWSKGCTIRFDH